MAYFRVSINRAKKERYDGPLLLTIVLAVPAAHAHHSQARFDQGRTITIDGVVARYGWANPHVYIFIDEITETGETVTWEIEAEPPAIMRRGGWSPETLRVGDVATVAIRGAATAGRILYLASMQRADHTLYDQQRLLTAMLSAA